jgi:predicted amidohydrolase
MTTLPVDPADVFAMLYDLVPDKAFTDGRVDKWLEDPAVERRSRELEEQVVEYGRLDELTLEFLGLAGASERFAALQGIDSALDRLSPFSGGTTGDGAALAPMLARYTERGCLNTTDIEGAVLFRCTFPGRPVGLPKKDEFFGLIRVSAETWRRVNFARVPPLLDLEVTGSARLDNLMTVCCAPLVESYDDLEIESTWRRWPAYRITPRTGPIAPRIGPIALAFESKEAAIAVLPESTLNPELLDAWRDCLRAHETELDQLTWVLVGSGPDGESNPPVNRAVLIHRSGEVLIEQDKMYDFTLTAKQIRRWHVPGLDLPGLSRFPKLVSRSEDIQCGSKLEIRESSLGRIAIMICEDLTRSALAEVVRQVGVSHIFVPVFSTEPPGSWAEFKSGDRVVEVGAWVVVATSLAVPRAVKPAKSEWSTSLAIGPKEDRDEWETQLQTRTSTNPGDVARFRIRGGRVLRFADFH